MIMDKSNLKIAVIAGEVSGDLLGADLIRELKRLTPRNVELVGVGGDGLHEQGLNPYFDYSELSIMGFTQVIKKLPSLLKRIKQTSEWIIRDQPDVLLLIDSPDFTHRVAKRVRKAMPHLPIINYVCPSVWAWKEYRAQAMLEYVDHVLALLPFEPKVMRQLGGPETTFVGHRLNSDVDVLAVREARLARQTIDDEKTIVLLPGSRSTEVTRILPVFKEAAQLFVDRNGPTMFLLPTVTKQLAFISNEIANWPKEIRPVISMEQGFKWSSFKEADAAWAASGTVILELALCNVPTVSVYKSDWIFTFLSKRIKTWTGALPNLIADYMLIPEYFNEVLRPAMLVRWAERLTSPTMQRATMLEGFDLVRERLATEVPPGQRGAEILLSYVNNKKAGV